MKRTKKLLSGILKDNRGSGIVMVLIGMICVTIMGVTLMYMSYIGLQMKVTDRQAADDFYDAAAAMDEIRAGLQIAVSDAVGDAYKTILINYNNDEYIGSAAEGGMAGKFKEEFLSKLNIWEFGTAPDNKNLFETGTLTTNGTYNPEALQSFISSSNAYVMTTPAESVYFYDDTKKQLCLKNVKVTYTSAKDYTTHVKADIVISMPEFTYVLSEFSISGLPEFAIIAREGLSQEGGNSQINIIGSAYAGSVNITNAGSQMKLAQGTLVCADTVHAMAGSAISRPAFLLDSSAFLWAERIEVGDTNNANCSIELAGTTYVADDLDLKGTGAKATLRGKYYGFGVSTSNPRESSAILVNAKETTLDMSNLERLMLGGFGFVSNSYYGDNIVAGTHAMMGESITTRMNQAAYLIPASYISNLTSNPIVIDASNDAPDAVLTSAGQAMLNTYNAGVKKVVANIPGASGQQMVYYFISFANGAGTNNSSSANQFFAYYFEKHPEEIVSYLKGYTTLNSSLGGMTQAAGYILTEKDGVYSVKKNVDAGILNHSAEQMERTFTQLKTTLFNVNQAVTEKDPYEYFIEEEKIKNDMSPNTITEFKNLMNQTVGIIVTGDFTLNNAFLTNDNYKNVNTIIVVNNDPTIGTDTDTRNDDTKVYIDEDFTGLIITSGTIVMRGSTLNMTATTDVTSSFTAVNSAGTKLGDYLRAGVIEDVTGENPFDDNGWNFGKMVTYSNWTKN